MAEPPNLSEESPQETPSQTSIEDPNLELLHKFSSQYFLHKQTSSFICLAQELCSKSDLRLTLSFFPNLTNPGLDEALDYIAPEVEHSPDGSDKYLEMCKNLNIVPMSRVINSLTTDTLNLKFYGITFKQMRGIAEALKVNSHVKYLTFQDSFLSPESTALVSDILRESESLRVLNLKECRIGREGAEKLCEGISTTQFLQELDLSCNDLGDAGLLLLQQSLIENTSIKKLNLGHNNLTEDSGETLHQLLLENKCLEELDLSWNGFFTAPGNKKLFGAMIKNEQITWLNMSWNGISTGPAMRPINRFIRRSKTLRFLDMSWNRLAHHPLNLLKGALTRNKSLEMVKVGNNIFTPEEAYDLAAVLRKSERLRVLDMENMSVNKNFLQLKKELRSKEKTVTHGHVLSNFEIHGPDITKLLFERCKFLAMKPKKKRLRKDFGHFILALPDKRASPEIFFGIMKKKRIKKLDKDLLKELLARFPAKKGTIDCVGMKEVYMTHYPNTKLPVETKKKRRKRKKKGNKEKKVKFEPPKNEGGENKKEQTVKTQ